MRTPVTYPQYRKYKNNKSFFCILSEKEWEEIQLIGTKALLYRFEVKIMPDRNFLEDMTWEFHENWDKIEEEEYRKMKELTHG